MTTLGLTKTEARFIPTKAQFIFLMLVYFLVQAISRGLVSETLGLDDSEQVFVARRWAWGYGPQPPFYTWLVLCFSSVLGWSSFTMALLKNLLLFFVYLFTYFNARHLTRSHAAAMAAAAALQFMPSIAWEAHRDLTHSVLASMMVMATLLVFFQLKPDRWKGYCLLGVCAGLGVLSKYNFPIFYLALLLAGLSLSAWRPLILNRRMILASLITLLIIAPNLIWIANHQDLAFASVSKFQMDSTGSWMACVKGLKKWGSNCFNHVIALITIFLIIFRGTLARLKKPASDSQKLLLRMFLGIAIMVAAGICILGVTTCQDRWLQPILIASPLLLVLIFHEQLSAGRLKALLIVSGVITLFVAIAAPGRILLTEALHKKEILNSPFRQLAADLKAPLAHAEAIHAENRWLAGNLRLWFPGKRITSPDTVRLYAPDTNCALIWDATGAEKSFPALLAVQPSGPVLDAAFHYEKQLKFHRTNTMRLGLILPGAGRP